MPLDLRRHPARRGRRLAAATAPAAARRVAGASSPPRRRRPPRGVSAAGASSSAPAPRSRPPRGVSGAGAGSGSAAPSAQPAAPRLVGRRALSSAPPPRRMPRGASASAAGSAGPWPAPAPRSASRIALPASPAGMAWHWSKASPSVPRRNACTIAGLSWGTTASGKRPSKSSGWQAAQCLAYDDRLHVLAALVRLVAERAGELRTVLDLGDRPPRPALLQILDALEVHLEVLGVVQLHLRGVAELGLLVQAHARELVRPSFTVTANSGCLAERAGSCGGTRTRLPSLVSRLPWHCTQWRSAICPSTVRPRCSTWQVAQRRGERPRWCGAGPGVAGLCRRRRRRVRKNVPASPPPPRPARPA